jgi:molybdopterin molybdotransferase
MITVQEADEILQKESFHPEIEFIDIKTSIGRVLAEDLKADRDFPPFNRVTMDGIAIRFNSIKNGITSFKIKGVQAAGEEASVSLNDHECIEIMTGAALPAFADTIIPYEELTINASTATLIGNSIQQGQNIHYRGKDKKKDEVIVRKGEIIDAITVSIAASIGAERLPVKKLPEVVIISTGNELTDINSKPNSYQIRQSNNYLLKAALEEYKINADFFHVRDDKQLIRKQLKESIDKYSIIMISGAVSKGKFDFMPELLQEAGFKTLFHGVLQRPGKPFWFGKNNKGNFVFAFPGNPVSTFLCFHRYFIPWLKHSLGIRESIIYAQLNNTISFSLPLQYFLQVGLYTDNSGILYANPVEGNGSGDFLNLNDANGFMELPLEQNTFSKGSVYRVWPFKKLL